MNIDQAERLPLVPETTLRAHKVYFPTDTRFRACARLQQALWRERNGMPIGTAIDVASRKKQYGHLLATGAAAAGANFISPLVHRVVYRELRYREPGALIDDRRLYGNLLASMPLAMNLFGPLKADNDLAERWVAECFPDMAGTVSNIQFEHSPGRGDPRFLADGTAFDVLISIRRPDGSKVFLAVEVKFSEGMTEPEARPRERYDELSASCGLFIDGDDPALRKNPFQQLWRQHMLAQSMIATGLYDAGRVVIIAPSLNTDVQRAASRFQKLLATGEGLVGFQSVSLEEAVHAVALAGDTDHARALALRYTDFSAVHGLI
jgi:hypothetical protein